MQQEGRERFPSAEVRPAEVRKGNTNACALRARHISFMWFRELLRLEVQVVQIWNRATVASELCVYTYSTPTKVPHTDIRQKKKHTNKQIFNRLDKPDLSPVTILAWGALRNYLN
jgi:hypothetical protein